MMKIQKHIPNIITSIRFPLTLMMLVFLSRNEYRAVLIVFALICATDILDGITARALSVCSCFGAGLDVSADLFYVMTSLVALNLLNIAPVWFTVITGMKFIEFWITSSVLKHTSGNGNLWFFDGIGRIFAALVFISPGIFTLSALSPGVWERITPVFLTSACALAAISSSARITRCFTAGKSPERISHRVAG